MPPPRTAARTVRAGIDLLGPGVPGRVLVPRRDLSPDGNPRRAWPPCPAMALHAPSHGTPPPHLLAMAMVARPRAPRWCRADSTWWWARNNYRHGARLSPQACQRSFLLVLELDSTVGALPADEIRWRDADSTMAPLRPLRHRGQRKEKTVMMGPTLLGEIELPLRLRGEGVFLPLKTGEILEDC